MPVRLTLPCAAAARASHAQPVPGLVCRVVPADKLVDEALAMGKKIASLSQPVIQMAKEAVNASFELTLAEGVRWERRLFHSTFATVRSRAATGTRVGAQVRGSLTRMRILVSTTARRAWQRSWRSASRSSSTSERCAHAACSWAAMQCNALHASHTGHCPYSSPHACRHVARVQSLPVQHSPHEFPHVVYNCPH